jgi:phage-related holin
MFNQATAVKVDILANNRVLHKIDRVLNRNAPIRDTSIVDFVVTNPDLTTLRKLLSLPVLAMP